MSSIKQSAQRIEVITPVLIKNKYINANGIETTYNGWSATDYIDISGFNFAYFYPFNNYWSFYDQSKSPKGRTSGVYGKTAIPNNAFYLRFSDETSRMRNVKLILSTLELFPTVLPIYESNKYVNTSGDVVAYNGWSISRVSQLDDYQGVFYNTLFNASYTSDGQVITSYTNYLPNEENVSYMLFSSSGISGKNVYLIPKI